MNKKTYFHRVHELTPTRFWINNVTEKHAHLAIENGAVGCTQNPAYTWKMLTNEDEDARRTAFRILDKNIRLEKDDNEVIVKTQKELVEIIAKIFLPIYEKSNGKYGYVSVQGDPFHEDFETIIRTAKLNRTAGPNIMVKIPATELGLGAIETLVREKTPINATEVMAVKQALDVCEAYERATRDMKNPAIIYFSHITGIYDEYLQNYVKDKKIEISSDVLWQSGISIAKKVYWMVREKSYDVGFIGGGARGLHHFTEMVGADCVVTINWKGTADVLIDKDPPVVQRFFQPTPDSVIDELVEKVDEYRRGYFVNAISIEEYEDFGPVVLFRTSFEDAWKNVLELIKKRRVELGE